MEFRSRDGQDKHIRTTDGGHCAIVGAEWRPLPNVKALHDAAYAQGCVSRDAPDDPEGNTAPDPVRLATNGIKALLERNQKGDFTGQGLPDLNALSKVCAFKVTKEILDAAWLAVQAEANQKP